MTNAQKTYRPSLHPLIAKARSAFIGHIEKYTHGPNAPRHKPLLFVACSGGADSLALASVAGFYHRRKDIRSGAIVLDHDLQDATAAVTEKTAQTLKQLGLDPVVHQKIRVMETGTGLEAAARAARYQAFMKIASEYNAAAIVTGHQADDQAEQVLLGLARGSGTGSLAGIAPHRVLAERNGHIYYLPHRLPIAEQPSGASTGAEPHHTVDIVRPFLNLTKQELQKICTLEKLDYWEDPSNYDSSYLRSRVRTKILPYLTQNLDSGLPQALSRTAAINRADDSFISAQAAAAFHLLAEHQKDDSTAVTLIFDIAALRMLPEAIRRRIYKEANASIQKSADLPRESSAVEPLAWERFHAIDNLIFNNHNNKKIQTPAMQPHQHIQWLKHKKTSASASRQAGEFLSAYGHYYAPLTIAESSEPAWLKGTDQFSSVGKYGTLMIQIKNT